MSEINRKIEKERQTERARERKREIERFVCIYTFNLHNADGIRADTCT